MKLFILSLTLAMALALPVPDNRSPYHQPATKYEHRDPYYQDEPVVLCANYPYCNEAPHGIYHLQASLHTEGQKRCIEFIDLWSNDAIMIKSLFMKTKL